MKKMEKFKIKVKSNNKKLILIGGKKKKCDYIEYNFL